jgi:hypothetical protein
VVEGEVVVSGVVPVVSFGRLAFFFLPGVVVEVSGVVVVVVALSGVVAPGSGVGLVSAVPGVWLGMVDWSVDGGIGVVCIGVGVAVGEVDGGVLGAGDVCATAEPASNVTEPKPAMIVVVIFT